ncbi:MAG: stage sporulation protein [Peptococcaceae bacterium]|jgi:stage II sporulation protein P|nr:stage sporulation protein [Peptococcaceae bacterium]
MKREKINRFIVYLSLLLIIVGGSLYYYESNPKVYNTVAEAGLELNFLDNLGKWEGERADGGYYTFVDENGKEIDQMARDVFIGDEIIAEDNNRYKVVRIEKDTVYCKLVGKENIAWLPEWDQVPVVNLAQGKNHVAIYMTHTDESYVPTDGTESKPGKGGIKQVGNTLGNALKEKGANAVVSFNNHDPHDANAYHRSRKTAVQLLKTNPIALIDVHRDGVPDPNSYRKVIDGKEATKVRLVVGRQNPHMSSNLEFAKQIKAYYDKNYPGLIKGIFMAKGNYNQDLGPRAILIEVGTHTNSRTAAERGVALFADGIPKVLGIAAVPGPAAPVPGAPGPQGAPSPGAGRSLLWLLAFLVIGGGAFLLLSTGSIKGSLNKLGGLGKEFANYLGPVQEKKRQDEEKNTKDPNK